MRGLIYKDISIFFKSIDKKLILIAAAAIVLLIFNAGIYAGLFASVMFAMTIGMQNIMSFASDEKASWKKYQLAMPISNFAVVASKYISVIYTVAISILGSIMFNGLSSVIFQNFDMEKFSAGTFGMFGGKETPVRMEFENRFVGVVLDRFGQDVMLIPRDEKHFSMQTHISVSPKFFGWLASLGTGAVIISPENVRREYISFMKNTLMNYGEE